MLEIHQVDLFSEEVTVSGVFCQRQVSVLVTESHTFML